MSEFIYAKRDFEKWIKNLNYDIADDPDMVKRSGSQKPEVRYQQSLNGLSDHEKAIINLLYDHFDEIGSADGRDDETRRPQRGKFIMELIKETDPNNLNTARPKFAEDENEVRAVKYLTRLEVSNFRGFGPREYCFEFKKEPPKDSPKKQKTKLALYNLFYGPNGSGKTSFCEALEYSILGSIEDAQAKGISLQSYIFHGGDEPSDRGLHSKNEREKSNHFVRLMGTDDITEDGLYPDTDRQFEIKPSKANLERYRFAFIERRRIDSFSNFGFRNVDTTERIATLLGCGQFFEYVKDLHHSERFLHHPEFLYGFGRLDEKREIADESIDFQKNGHCKKMLEALHKIVSRLNLHISYLLNETGPNNEFFKKTCDLYNEMNKDDADSERIENINFFGRNVSAPFCFARSCIEIKLNNGTKGNALRLLSEGHVKLIGLAMLLAAAVMNEVPFLVFDDIVNAIDDDHRDGIAQLLMTSPDFKGKQLFLTCHGDVFLEQLKKYAGKDGFSAFTFLRSDLREGDGIDFRKDEEAAKTKVERAQDYLYLGRKREAAAACRQALELICEQLWAIIGKVEPLKVKIEDLDSRPALKRQVRAIAEAIDKNKSEDKVVPQIHEKLVFLLAEENWPLLNKGTHEDATTREFTSKQVGEIVEKVGELRDLAGKLNMISFETKIDTETDSVSLENTANNIKGNNTEQNYIFPGIFEATKIIEEYHKCVREAGKKVCALSRKLSDIASSNKRNVTEDTNNSQSATPYDKYASIKMTNDIISRIEECIESYKNIVSRNCEKEQEILNAINDLANLTIEWKIGSVNKSR